MLAKEAAKVIPKVAKNAVAPFIPRTAFPNYNITLSNYQGHHQKALTKFRHLAPQIDLVLELRDSRAPIATSNFLFDHVLGTKDKIYLYTKKDLLKLDSSLLDSWHRGSPWKLIDCRSKPDAEAVLELVKQKYASMKPPPPLGLRLLVIGMPNVGKSTFVNTLRHAGYRYSSISSKRSNVAKTGGQPGVTRATSEMIRICDKPNLLMHDTPGVFMPRVKDVETMITLALVGAVHSSLVDPVIQADYLLFILNLQDPTGKKYLEYMNHPTNNVNELLYYIAQTRGVIKKNGSFDEDGMAAHWVNKWRQGKHKRFKTCFDSQLALRSPQEIYEVFKDEKKRIQDIALTTGNIDRLSEENSSSKRRIRTAKDREYDIRNALFKL